MNIIFLQLISFNAAVERCAGASTVTLLKNRNDTAINRHYRTEYDSQQMEY